jgi:hypothetical protein
MEEGALETCANAGNMAITPKIPSRLVFMRESPIQISIHHRGGGSATRRGLI